MTDRELLEKIAAQIGVIDYRFDEMESQFNGLENRFDRLESRFDGLESRFDGLESRFDGLESRFDGLEEEMHKGFKNVDTKINQLDSEVKDVKRRVIKIEDEHGKKLSALFDGYKQHSDILARIENEISKHEEIILRRIQ
jgi:predicted  nucleic acid-binding Zn-ribbon protein